MKKDLDVLEGNLGVMEGIMGVMKDDLRVMEDDLLKPLITFGQLLYRFCTFCDLTLL